MRNRNLINRKLDNLEATLKTLNSIVNTQSPIESYRANIVKAEGIVDELRSMVEAEPMASNELNKY
jgi:hypothetical protein